jgi:hypothetical protein
MLSLFEIMYWEGLRKCGNIATDGDKLASGDVNLFSKNINIIKTNAETVSDTGKCKNR